VLIWFLHAQSWRRHWKYSRSGQIIEQPSTQRSSRRRSDLRCAAIWSPVVRRARDGQQRNRLREIFQPLPRFRWFAFTMRLAMWSKRGSTTNPLRPWGNHRTNTPVQPGPRYVTCLL